MITIRPDQMEIFKEYSVKTFIQKSVSFLKKTAPGFTDDKTDNEIREFIKKMIDFSKEHNIKKEKHVQRMLLLKINHNFDDRLPDNLNFVLNENSFSEEYRLEKFIHQLSSNIQRTKITLDDEI
jgi:RNA processing factor Prp31